MPNSLILAALFVLVGASNAQECPSGCEDVFDGDGIVSVNELVRAGGNLLSPEVCTPPRQVCNSVPTPQQCIDAPDGLILNNCMKDSPYSFSISLASNKRGLLIISPPQHNLRVP